MNIYQKLIEVRKEVTYLQKENTGNQYKYVSSSQVLANVRAKMDELGLLLIPKVLDHKLSESAIEQYDTSGRVNKRTITYFTELDIEFTWINADSPEEKIVCNWYGQGVDIAGEKGVGKALTYAEKYFMLKFFNIATDKDDPDRFQQKHEDKEQPKQEPKKQEQPKKQDNVTPIDVITPAQITRLFTISNSNKELCKEVIEKYGYTSSKEIKKTDYEKICNEIESIVKGA